MSRLSRYRHWFVAGFSPKALHFLSRTPPCIVLFLVIIIVAVASIKIVLHYVETVFTHSVDRFVDQYPGAQGALFCADVFNVDTTNNIISVRWSVVGGCGSNYTFNSSDGCSINSLAVPMNLYLNKNASTPVSALTPILQYDPADINSSPPVHMLPGRTNLPMFAFETDLDIDPFLPYTLYKKQTGLFSPFEVINSFNSVLATHPANNATIPIVDVIGYGTSLSWISEAHRGTSPNSQQFWIQFWSIRQRLVRGIAVIIVITNWLLTLAILYITVLVVMGRKVDTQLILASTTILFAIPQIRASMLDSPPLGAVCIDTAGYFVNLSLVSACVRPIFTLSYN
ncbi:hypothetical protein BD410DRAFT_872994 [Rickenella mellea]|uniref:Uncharacterized protein n=1 Tax=Rickenella mellea TaxID=50990 RepID=A0A4Y7PXB4_9AGAM|nr:hypothetical protein BD410DRAFT_872994 [Rickenella mellea]